MNLVEKFIEIYKDKHNLKYKTDVIRGVNKTLGTNYKYETMFNWASEKNPRQVPDDAEKFMREYVIDHIIEQENIDLKPAEKKKIIATLNDELMCRKIALHSLLENKIKLTSKKHNELSKLLDPPYKVKST